MHSFEEVIHCLDQSIRQFVQTTPIGGLTVALTDRHHLLHSAQYGYADIAAHAPVIPETRFEICSITKTFTSLAVMQQYEAGTLDIHAPITSYLPWFQVHSLYEEPITAHHLMSHTAGLVAGSERSLGSRHAIWLLRDTELASAPGTAFHYSDVGYETLGALLETVLGQHFPTLLQQQILDPLDMYSSFPSNTYEGRKTLALGYHSFYDDRPSHRSYPLVPAPWFEYESPAGCVLSTATDMATYLRMYLNHGQGPHGRLLSENSFDLMIQAIAPEKLFLWQGEQDCVMPLALTRLLAQGLPYCVATFYPNEDLLSTFVNHTQEIWNTFSVCRWLTGRWW